MSPASALQQLSTDGRKRATPVLDKLQAARAQLGRRTMAALVEGVWQGLGGAQTLTRPAAEQAEARLYLQTLQQAEQQGQLDDMNDFQQLLEQQFTEGDPPDAKVKLEILTMHGAKGLEWDLVLLPGLHRGTGRPKSTLLHWQSYTPVSGGEQLLLAPLRSAQQADNSKLINMIRNEEQRRSRFETQRLLYVAATRARQQLVLSTVLDADKAQDEQKPNKQSLLAMLWPGLGDAFFLDLEASADTQVDAEATADSMPDQSIRRLPAGWQPELRPAYAWTPSLPLREREQEIEFNWAGQTARRTGTVIHSLLELIAGIGIEQLGADQLQRIRQRIPALLAMHGIAAAELDAQTRRVNAALEATLQDEHGRWLLSAQPHRCCLRTGAERHAGW